MIKSTITATIDVTLIVDGEISKDAAEVLIKSHVDADNTSVKNIKVFTMDEKGTM